MSDRRLAGLMTLTRIGVLARAKLSVVAELVPQTVVGTRFPVSCHRSDAHRHDARFGSWAPSSCHPDIPLSYSGPDELQARRRRSGHVPFWPSSTVHAFPSSRPVLSVPRPWAKSSLVPSESSNPASVAYCPSCVGRLPRASRAGARPYGALGARHGAGRLVDLAEPSVSAHAGCGP